ncbi:hypothetical protein [Terrihabitans rhizophilus]|uniref:Transcriptional regulator n=1 Tax=Terrihabitans rhizophilus TaxID=3092662 RepID=A0ABU4RNA2_9HYPH|nr:hypothetical protein [Terrihabitans sp. PJ23]MDX6806314.1 hypothetical protein [Terrihabitans sp. PJ23]
MSKKTYQALPGVEWVNGSRVPESREIKLTAAEARFDLDQGRIELKEEREIAVPAEAEPATPAQAAKRR